MAKTKRRFKETPKWRTKQSLRNKRRRKARKDKEQKSKCNVNSFRLSKLNQISYPNEGDPELCKARVDGGMKCWCADYCHCNDCQHSRYENGREPCTGAIQECPDACKKCSNYKPCWRW